MLWLAAVTSVAGIARLAIDTAGRQVTSTPIAAPLPSEIPVEPSEFPSASSAKLVPTNTATHRPAQTNRPKTLRGLASQSVVSPEHTVTAVASTYTTMAGRVRAGCEGDKISLDGGYAQPAPGWAIRVASGGPRRVQVIFYVPPEWGLLVIAGCLDGRPRFDQRRIGRGFQDDRGRAAGRGDGRYPTSDPVTGYPISGGGLAELSGLANLAS
jgi:hypothetical protein